MTPLRLNVVRFLALLLLVWSSGAHAGPKKLPPQPIDPKTATDHDGQPIPEPDFREKSLYGHQLREAIVEPLSQSFDVPDRILHLLGKGPRHEAVNVNAYDEVANSTWFTNRNHFRAMAPDSVRLGSARAEVIPTPPFTIKSRKQGGVNPGFTIKDKNGKRWVVKLDRPGYPQLGSGADVVVDRLFWAAGYNVSHDVACTFGRDELVIDDELKQGKDKAPPFGEADLDSLLLRGDRGADGRYSGQASLYLEGKPVGPIDMRLRRPDDPNDRFRHRNRRELRGLYVLCSWVGSWDTKDHQSLDTFIESVDSLGFVRHHLLDFGASIGAAAEGPRPPERGYEYTIDGKWMAFRLLTLGFVSEPWRRIPREVPIPSLGNFESQVWQPNQFKSLQPHGAFHEMTAGDAYWGAKLVASFSDAQIAAAIDAVGYEDPRVKPAMLQLLKERRDKIMRYWFAKVVPLDFFEVKSGQLRFRDLAVDRGIASPRAYSIHVEGPGIAQEHLSASETALDLAQLGPRATRAELEFEIEGLNAKSVIVNLHREGNAWTIERIRHG
ncbi:MAG: hypothetical protein ABI960_07190 [Candidatus Eisenbacteria bacterium]